MRKLIPALIGCLVMAGCDKSDEKNPIQIEGFKLFDHFGNTIGTVGPADHDWEFVNWNTLSAKEQQLLNTSDAVNTNNTVVSTVNVHPYPNPVRDQSSVLAQSTDSVKFKLIVTDKTGGVLIQVAEKIKGSKSFSLDLSNRNLFPFGKDLRYYYSFSAAGNPHFKVGYGDIRVCDYSGGGNPITVCF